MVKGHFKWKQQGYWALMQGDVGRAAVAMYTEQIAARANALAQDEGAVYTAKVRPGARTRHKVQLGTVATGNAESMADNADNNTLAKAMTGGA